MAISDTLSSIITNLSNAYSQIGTMGGTIPLSKNMENLPSAIGTIPQSGGGGISDQDILEGTITTINNSSASFVTTCALYGNRSLTLASLPNVETINNSAFYLCDGLESVYAPICKTIGMQGFSSCIRLSNITLGSCFSVGSSAFNGCSSLKQFEMNGSPDNANIRIWNSAFYGCYSLGKVVIDMTDIPSGGNPSIYSGAFMNCSILSALIIIGGYMSIPSASAAARSVFYYTPMSQSTYLGHYGSIYVDPSLVATYKSASGWSVYSARITSNPDLL